MGDNAAAHLLMPNSFRQTQSGKLPPATRLSALSCRDVLHYLGKSVPPASYGGCHGEAKIDLRARPEGTRWKFWYGSNSIKLYDKEAPVAGTLRLETTINDPSGYRVWRTKGGRQRRGGQVVAATTQGGGRSGPPRGSQ